MCIRKVTLKASNYWNIVKKEDFLKLSLNIGSLLTLSLLKVSGISVKQFYKMILYKFYVVYKKSHLKSASKKLAVGTFLFVALCVFMLCK